MEEILRSEVFDHFDKTYLLDRIKGNMTGPVVRITETVHNGTRRGQHIVEIDPWVLKKIQELMEAPVQHHTAGIPGRKSKPFIFTPEQMDKIVASYLRGVPSTDLALQIGCRKDDIISMLMSRDIPVVNEEPENKRSRRRWRKK